MPSKKNSNQCAKYKALQQNISMEWEIRIARLVMLCKEQNMPYFWLCILFSWKYRTFKTFHQKNCFHVFNIFCLRNSSPKNYLREIM
jgi:hypothetical protein